MADKILKINITGRDNPKYLLQLQIAATQIALDIGWPYIDFDGSINSFTVWGKDYNMFLSNDCGTINLDYNFDDKLILPGIWECSVLDDDSILDELLFENNYPNFNDNPYFPIILDITKPISCILYKIKDNERFSFPLNLFHVPLFSGFIDTKTLSFDENEKLFTFTASPNMDYLKKADVTNIKLVRPEALEIPDTHLSFRDNLYYLLQVAFPDLNKDNITIAHDFVFYAHDDPNHKFSTRIAATLYATETLRTFSIHDLFFNIRDIKTRCGVNSCYEVLQLLCFSYFATLTVTHNKAVFASINKSFKTLNTVDGTRMISSFKKEISFDRLYWIKITEVWSNNAGTINTTIGTELTTTKGFNKTIVHFLQVFKLFPNENIYQFLSHIKVKNSSNSFSDVLFALDKPDSLQPVSFIKMIAKLWFDYLNVFTSGRIYKFQITNTDFDFTNSLGYQNRLYSPVGIHYNIVEDSTEVEAVRN